ncbi:hypothetical protein HUG20_16680 [Salicibibacter cibi]|uniref:Uncharacterized protein n=1 Tax=Salicibibacter cibi TaxID=2743001 RepID=A0A7T6ZDH0_9BACI|nr:hypothetical protein [Salicibibacter cibi]QQK81382.1 hypothetical protein HUG20_16680 [Salicibibacter cibi]
MPILLLFILIGCSSTEITEIVDKKDILQEDVDCGDPEEDLESNVHTIAGQFSEGDMNELKERLNGSVLDSQDALEQEMEMMSAHICVDKEDDNLDDKAKMYVSMLEYYYMMMQGEEELMVDIIALVFTEPVSRATKQISGYPLSR